MTFLLVLIGFSATVGALSLGFASGLSSAGKTGLVMNLVLLLGVLFAGFLANKGSIPAWLRWISWLSVFRCVATPRRAEPAHAYAPSRHAAPRRAPRCGACAQVSCAASHLLNHAFDSCRSSPQPTRPDCLTQPRPQVCVGGRRHQRAEQHRPLPVSARRRALAAHEGHRVPAGASASGLSPCHAAVPCQHARVGAVSPRHAMPACAAAAGALSPRHASVHCCRRRWCIVALPRQRTSLLSESRSDADGRCRARACPAPQVIGVDAGMMLADVAVLAAMYAACCAFVFAVIAWRNRQARD